MPVVVKESTTIAEPVRYRKPRNQLISNTDPNPRQIPSINQTTRCKSSISSLLLSTLTPGTTSDDPTTPTTTKMKYFTSTTIRGLGCTAPSQVSVPAVIRTSANWEGKKVRKKKQKKNKAPSRAVAMLTTNNPPPPPTPPPLPPPSSSCLVLPDVWCGPGIGFTTDGASDCVVARRPVSGRGKVDGEKMNLRERSSCRARRMVNPEDLSFFDSDTGMSQARLDMFGSRRHRHVRHPSPEGLAEIVMLQSSLLMGGRSDGLDPYRDWRLDVDSMSYEELLELGDKIGYVSTGLREDEIIRFLRKTRLSVLDDISSHFPTKMQFKCSICQEEYEAEDEMGKLDCGHFYHIHCIKQWLVLKKTCPICKTSVLSQQ